MQFQPKTKNELAADGLLPKGWYDFEVMSAEDAVSKKSGNEMIKLKLRVFRPAGGEKHVYDYLIESAPTHLFEFCEATGLEAKYHAGTLKAEDCELKAAKVKIGIDDKNEAYAPKNVAKNYAHPKSLTKETSSAAPAPDDDEIPF
jgi:hypothetical protein